jgi:hypothetical protein
MTGRFVRHTKKPGLKSRLRNTSCDGDAIDSASHVFSAHSIRGSLQPIDTHEIAEAQLATVDELMGSIREALLASGSAGLKYRSELNDMTLNLLMEAGRIKKRS